jgi:hypothetical protein
VNGSTAWSASRFAALGPGYRRTAARDPYSSGYPQRRRGETLGEQGQDWRPLPDFGRFPSSNLDDAKLWLGGQLLNASALMGRGRKKSHGNSGS